MRDVRQWDESDLVLLLEADQKENTTVDYKGSEALAFKDKTVRSDGKGTLGEKHREDLIRDVASMANAEGGQIIYGIAERKGGYPDHIDDGADPKKVSADQIEQIIIHNINPRVEGFIVHPIELKSKGKGTFAFVISISKAQNNAPHQSDDKLYHKRNDSTKFAMEDNEIRDMVSRSLEFGRKFGIAWDMLVEMRRIVVSATERSQIGAGVRVARTRLLIAVLLSLRSSGVAIMALPRELREKAARLINDLDEYNSIIETTDPGLRDEARLTERTRGLLHNIIGNGNAICDGLLTVLEDQPL
jgi:Putative DNA-binding domain